MSLTNKFTATCSKCGKQVAENTGLTDKAPNGRWNTRHVDCGSFIAPRQIASSSFGHYPTSDYYDRDYKDEHGWTEYDWQEACNPNEGDK